MTYEGYRSIVLWNRRVLPWFQYGDNLGLSPSGRDLILHETYGGMVVCISLLHSCLCV